jgi:PAT family beta-lactamase induction signal transducer AmpG
VYFGGAAARNQPSMITLPQAAPAVPTIVEHRTLRFLLIFLLYIAQGLPIGVFLFALPAWLAANGATAAEVGALVGAAALPWSLKFFNGFVMDRFAWLPMGRRRPWLIVAQTAIVGGFAAFALTNPGIADLWLLSAFAFAINLATTFQDVAIDGMAVDLVPPAERARVNGFMFGGQSIGIWAGTAGSGFLLGRYGLPGAIAMNATIVAMILALIVIFRERPGEKILPWTAGEASSENLAKHARAWKPLFKTTFRELLRPDSIKLISGLFLLGTIYGTYLGVQPLVATGPGGWTDTAFSSLTGTGNLVAGILGVFLFGRLADRVTPRRTAMAGALGVAALAATFAGASAYWGSEALIAIYVFAHLSLYLLIQISLCSIAMGRCHPKVSATQFTLYMAVSNMGISSAAGFLGVLDALGGLRAMYAAVVLAGVLLFLAGSVFKSAYARERDV